MRTNVGRPGPRPGRLGHTSVVAARALLVCSPVASPQPLEHPTATQHFRVEPNALSYAEMWAGSRLSFPISAACKLLRVRLPTTVCVPLSRALTRVDWDAIPEAARAELGGAVEALEAQGFSQALVYTEDWRGAGLETFSVALLDDARTTLAVVMYTAFRPPNGRPAFEHVDCNLYARSNDGRLLITTSTQYPLRAPPEYDALVLPPLPAGEVAQRHARRVAELHAGGPPYRQPQPLVAIDPDQVESTLLALSRRDVEFQRSRGVYVPVSPEELAGFDEAAAADRVSPWRVLGLWAVVIVLVLVIANLLQR